MIEFEIKGQELTACQPVIASKAQDYLTAKFKFSKDWEGCAKVATFAKGDTKYTILIENDEITEDKHIYLTAGIWLFGVVGTLGTKVITTTPARLMVEECAPHDGDPFPEIPESLAQQILNEAKTAKDTAQSVRDDANAGKFDGKTPIKGVDYFTEADKREFTAEVEESLKPTLDLKADKTYVDEELVKKADKSNIPTKTSELENDSDFVTSVDIEGKADLSYVNEELGKKADKSEIPTDLVSDVKINGVSIVADKVADIPLATNNKAGLIIPNVGFSSLAETNGVLYGQTRDKAFFESASNNHLTSFGTLKNVLGDYEKVGVYELLLDTTLEEAINRLYINDVRLKKVFISCDAPAGSSTIQGIFKCYSDKGGYFDYYINGLFTTSARAGQFIADVSEGIINIIGVTNTTYRSTAIPNMANMMLEGDYISSVQFGGNGTNLMPIGTRVRIYGVKA